MASSLNAKTVLEFDIALILDGEGTTWIQNKLKDGDALEFFALYGYFLLRKSDEKSVVFFGADSDSVCPESMMLALLESGGARDIILCHGARDFEELAVKHENFTYLPRPLWTKTEPEWNCPPMIDVWITMLVSARLFEKDMFMEKFFNAADAEAESKKSPLFKNI